MPTLIDIAAASLLVMLASLVGVVALWRQAGNFLTKNLDFLVSFSAGVFVVFLYGLMTEALEHSSSLTSGLLWVGCGAIGVWTATKLLPALHQHHEHEGHTHHAIDPRRMMLTDGIHNAADGVVLAASFAAGAMVGWAAAVSIFVHELLQEVAEFFVLRDAGYTTRGALTANLLVSSTILIGSIGGYYLLGLFEALEGPLLGIAAGGVLVVVLHDLIPHSVREAHSHAHYVQHMVWFVVGALLMYGVTALVSHEEPAGHETALLALAQDLS